MKHKFNFSNRVSIGSIAVVDTPVSKRSQVSNKCRLTVGRLSALLLLLFTLGIGQMWGKTIYLDVSGPETNNNWGRTDACNGSPASFAVWCWGDGSERWGNNGQVLSLADGETVIYKAEIDNSVTNLKFARLNCDRVCDWSKKWNDSKDLTVPSDGKNMFSLTSWGDDGNNCDGTWSTYTPTFQGGEVFYMKQNTIAKTDGQSHDFLKHGSCEFKLYDTNGTELNKSVTVTSAMPNTNPAMLKFVIPNEWAGTVWGQVKVKQGGGSNATDKGNIPTDGKNYLINGNTWEWGTYTEPTPYTGDLYLIGGACTGQDWNLSNGAKLDNDGHGIYTITREIKTPDSSNKDGFKFIQQLNDNQWPNQWRPTYDNAKQDLADGQKAEVLTPDVSNVVVKKDPCGSDTKWQVTKTGTYTITVDLSDKDNGKMSITSSTPTPTAYYIGGRLGFSKDEWGTSHPLTYDEASGYYKYETGKTVAELSAKLDNADQYFIIHTGTSSGVWYSATSSLCHDFETKKGESNAYSMTKRENTTQDNSRRFIFSDTGDNSGPVTIWFNAKEDTKKVWYTVPDSPTPSSPWKIKGEFDSWTSHDLSGTGTTGTYTYTGLSANKTYSFGLEDPNSAYFKGGTTITSSNPTATLTKENSATNAQITTSSAGDYVFTVDYSNANSPIVTVTYPSAPTLPYEYYMTGDLWDVCKGFNGYSKDTEAWTNAGSDDNLPFMAHMVKNGGEASISFVAPKVQFRFDIEEYQRTNTVNNIKIDPTGNLGDKATRSSEKYKVNLRDISSITGPSIITVTYNGSGVTINQQPYTPNPSAYAGWKVLLYKDTDGNNETEVGSLDANGQFVTDELTNGTKYRLRITDGTDGKLCGINWFGGLYFDQTSGTDIVTYPTQTYHGNDNTKFDPSSWPVAYKYNATGVFTMKANGKLQITFDGGKITITKLEPLSGDWYVMGGHNGWCTSCAEHQMTVANGVATKVYKNNMGNFDFKVYGNDTEHGWSYYSQGKSNVTCTKVDAAIPNIKIPSLSEPNDITISYDGVNVYVNATPFTPSLDDDYYIFGAGGTNWVSGWSSAKWFDEYKMTSNGTVASKTFQYVKGSCLFKIWKKSTGNEELKNANIDNSHEGANLTLEADGDTNIKFNLGDTYSDVTIYTDGKKVWASKTTSDTNKKKVMFNLSNGNWPIPVQLVENGGKATKPANPTKNNNTFQGWYKNPELTQAYTWSDPVNEDITLYAKWTYTNNDSYWLVGSFMCGEWGQCLDKAIQMTKNGDHLEATLPEFYTTTSLQFKVNKDGAGSWDKTIPYSSFSSARSTSENASYSENSGNIKLDMSGSTLRSVTMCYDGVNTYLILTQPDTKTVTFKDGDLTVKTVSVVSGGTVSTPTIEHRGATIGKWYTDQACTHEFNFSTAITEDKTLYAGNISLLNQNYYIVGNIWQNWERQNKTPQMTKNGNVASYTYIAPVGFNEIQLTTNNRDEGNYIDTRFFNASASASGVESAGENKNLQFTISDQPKQVTVTFDGQITVTMQNYTQKYIDNLYLTTNSSWAKYFDSEGNTSDVGGWAKKANALRQEGNTAYVIIRDVQTGDRQWKFLGNEDDDSKAGVNLFNAMYVDVSNPSSNIEWANNYNNSLKRNLPYSDVSWRNIQFTVKNQCQLKLIFDGGLIRVIDLPQYTVTFKDGETTKKTQTLYEEERATAPTDITGLYGWRANSPTEGDIITDVNSIPVKANVTYYAVKQVSSISISADKNTLDIGETLQLSVNYTPADAEWDKSVTWSSDNTQFLTVDENGLVTAKAQTDGIDIRATTPNGKTATYQIKVNAPACTTWMISYWNNNSGNKYSGTQCFTQVGESHEWRADFTLKTYSDDDWFWIGDGGFTDHSKNWTTKGIKFYGLTKGDCGDANWYPGQDVEGQLVIDDNSTAENYGVTFDPVYTLVYNDGTEWKWTPFTRTGDVEEETALMKMWNYTNTNLEYYVGLKQTNNPKMFHGDKSHTDPLVSVNGLKDANWDGKYGKFHIYDNSCDRNNNWYCEFIPYFTYELRNDADEIIYVAPGCPANAGDKSTTIYNKNLPTKTGYTQIGWSRSIGGAKVLDLGAAYDYYTSPDILYPVWQAKTYTVTLMNGDQKVRDVTATYNAAMPAMGEKPTKTGYTFAGFYTEQGGQGTQYYNGSGTSTHVYDTDGDMILYAHWTINQYNVSWVTDGDALTGDYTRGKVNFGTTIVAPNEPTKTGYTFAAWTPTVDATVPDRDVTYTATWDMIDITGVTLDKTSVTLKPEGTQQLTATVLPAGVIKTLTWTSSNTAVATVNNDGKITAVDEGEAIITCKATNDKGSQTATCTVTVSACSYAYSSIYTNTITGITATTVVSSVGGSGSVANLFDPTSQTEPATFTTARLQIGRDNSETYYAYYNGTEDDYLYATKSTTEPTITWRIDQVESKTGVYYIHTTDDKYIYIDKSKQLSDNGGWPTYAPRVGDFDSDDKDKFQWQLGTTGGGNYPHILSLNSQYSLHRRHWSVDWLWRNAPEHVVACGGDIDQGSGKYEDFVSMFVKSDGTQGTEESPNPNYKQSPVNSSYYRFASGATMTSTVTGGLKEEDKIIVHCYNPGTSGVTGTLTIGSDVQPITISAGETKTYEYLVQADANSSIVVASNSIDFCVSHVEVQRNLPTEYFTPTITWTPEPVSEMTVGQTYTSVATATGKGTITYTSSNELIATVDDGGTVTPISNGSVTITATVAAHDCYNSASDSYTATVTGGLEPPTITFTTLPTDAPQGSVQTVVVTTTGGANFNLTIVGDPGATLEFVSQEEKRIEAKVKVRANASNITLRATTEEDSDFAATTKDATLTVSACDPDGDNIFTFTMAGTDDAAGQTADGVIGGTVDQSDLATVGTEDNPATADIVTIKFDGKYMVDASGDAEVTEESTIDDNSNMWYKIPTNIKSSTSEDVFYLKNKKNNSYLYKDNSGSILGNNDSWKYYPTKTNTTNAKSDIYQWFVKNSNRIVNLNGYTKDLSTSHAMRLAKTEVVNTWKNPKIATGKGGNNGHAEWTPQIGVVESSVANPDMIKSVEYNSKTYYLLAGGTVTVNCPLKAGDKITLDMYNRNTGEDASIIITLDADANSYDITDGGNHYLYLHSITIWRDQIGEMVTPTLTWDADLTKPVMLANGGSVKHVATSDVTTIETITYTSSNTDVATVEEDGTVTMKETPASAPTTITATLQGVGCYNTATCTYVVIPTTNIFNSAATNMLWSNPDNWSSKVLPDAETDVIIQAKAIVDINTAAANTVVIDDNGHNAEIEILSTGGLQVEGTIKRTENGSDFGPTTIHDLYIHSDDTGTGALVFNNNNACQAYVEMYSKAYTEGVKYWQYLGAPVSGTNLNVDFYGAYTYSYAESNGWTRVKNGEMTPWIGWGITQDHTTTYVLNGTLQPTTEKVINLTYTKEGAEGCNLIANSWMAPIDITKMEETDFGDGAKATIFMYNTGRDKSETEVIYGEGTDKTPGQWVTIPIKSAKQPEWEGPKAIPAMQAFEVDVTKNTTLTLNYNTVVRHKDAAIGTNPLRTPARKADNEDAVSMMRIRVEGQNMHVDQYLLEGENFTTGFDNGWDGNHVEGDGRSAGFYSVNSELGNMAVNALPEIEGTLLGFVPNDEQAFTISFGYNGDKTYYLNDLMEEKSTLIRNDQTYFFLVGGNDIVHRFQISTTPFESYIGTGSDNIGNGVQKAVKFIENDKLFILRNGRLYDGTGKALKPGK